MIGPRLSSSWMAAKAASAVIAEPSADQSSDSSRERVGNVVFIALMDVQLRGLFAPPSLVPSRGGRDSGRARRSNRQALRPSAERSTHVRLPCKLRTARQV